MWTVESDRNHITDELFDKTYDVEIFSWNAMVDQH